MMELVLVLKDTLVKLGQDGNEIGWTITQDRLSGGQMIIRSDGTIESGLK